MDAFQYSSPFLFILDEAFELMKLIDFLQHVSDCRAFANFLDVGFCRNTICPSPIALNEFDSFPNLQYVCVLSLTSVQLFEVPWSTLGSCNIGSVA